MPDYGYLLKPPDAFTVSHSPSNKAKKGTDTVKHALDGLSVHLKVIHGLPNDKCIKRKGQSHLFVEKIGPRASGHGTAALEAWALGLPVISDAHQEAAELIRREIGYLPFCKCSTEGELRKMVKMMAA